MSVITKPAPTAAPAGGRRRWPLVALAVATVAMTGYLVSAYVPPDLSTSRIPLQGTTHYVVLVAHIFTATVATVTGLAQFWPWLRSRHPRVHRWTGRAYFFLGVFPSALLAIPVSLLAPFGAANQAGLLTLDALWLATAVAGYRSARRRRYADHRRWMIRNYALTLSSLATRIFIPVMVLAILPQTAVYHGDELAIGHDIASGSAWLGLVATMLVAEGYLQRRYGVPRRQVAAS